MREVKGHTAEDPGRRNFLRDRQYIEADIADSTLLGADCSSNVNRAGGGSTSTHEVHIAELQQGV